MMLRSIRFRLSIWYFAALFLALIAFGSSTWMTMRHSLYETVDDSLRDRINGVRQFMEVQIEALSMEEIRQEFREHSVLGPGGDLFQVCDSEGNWLYRSAPLAGSEVRILLPLRLPEQGLYEDLTVQNTRLRTYSARVDVRGQPYSVQVAVPVEELAEALARYRLTLILMIPAALLVASGGGFWLSRRALSPVDRIIRDAQSISSQNLQKRLDVPLSGDELQRLSETLNQMLERLEQAFRRITQFTADASHELRTPVAVIRTTAELALRHPRSTSEYASALSDILAQSERTTELIDSLLTLARSDTGQHELRLNSVDLCEVIREAVEMGRRFAATKGLDFKAPMEDRNLLVMGDAHSLSRLALILIDNAIKYTEAPGTVGVHTNSTGGSAVLEIHDSGIGIAPEELPHIFERFYRADPARGSETGGAGLGLAIAHWIVQQHHGEITVSSSAGSGSTFRVSIPLAGQRETASS
jgi:heavy metal sensor kinase